MPKTTKGSRSPDDGLMSRGDVLHHLAINGVMLRKLIRDGVLEPVRWNGEEAFYLADVNAAAHVIKRRLTVTTANRNALRALAISLRSQRKLEDLMVAFGVEPTFEPLTVERVMDFWSTVHAPQKMTELSADEIVAWARFFYAIDVGFLVMAGSIYQTSEPWLPFMNFAHTLLSSAPRKSSHEVTAAYAYLQSTVRWMRNGAYLYCRNILGPAVANRVFPDEHDTNITNSLLAFVNYLEDAKARERAH